MTIEHLIAAVPPPIRPLDAFAGPWEPVEAEIGTVLPQDYKDLVRLYGSGHWMQFFGIDVPRSRNRYLRLEANILSVRDYFVLDEEAPYSLWPDPCGLIPFGCTDNGDYLFWRPKGSPENWGVVIADRGSGYEAFETFDCDLTDFLAGVVTGKYVPKTFFEDLPTAAPLFAPHNSEGHNDTASHSSQVHYSLKMPADWINGSFGGHGVRPATGTPAISIKIQK